MVPTVTMTELRQELRKKVALDERVENVPIVRELRELGIKPNLVARHLDISVVAANHFMTGKRDVPARHIPYLLMVLWASVESWEGMIREFRQQPMAPEWKRKVAKYQEIATECEKKLALYESVWIAGPDLKKRDGMASEREEFLAELKRGFLKTENARRETVARQDKVAKAEKEGRATVKKGRAKRAAKK